jgi:DNA-binding transcriptional MerR regulator
MAQIQFLIPTFYISPNSNNLDFQSFLNLAYSEEKTKRSCSMIHVLRYTEELEKVGFSTEQAKKSVQPWMDLMDQNFATKADFKEHYFMTKTDLKEVQTEMKELKSEIQNEMKKLKNEIQNELKDMKSDFKTDMKDLEHRLTIRLGIMLASSIGVISALITFKH